MTKNRLQALATAVQFFFGGWFLAHGLNHWLEFFPRPQGSSPISRELIGALNHSGLFPIVKVLEVLTGAMLLANRFVPLAAVIAFPITFSIAHLNFVANGDAFSIGVAGVAIAMNGIICLAHLDAYRPMLAMGGAEAATRGFRHLLWIAFGIAAPILFTFWATSDSGPRSQQHYQEVKRELSPPSAAPTSAPQP